MLGDASRYGLAMRITEKTIELTFAAQCAAFMPAKPIWFGLSQQQEARLGFDACTRMNAALMLFQFKASSKGTNRLRKYTAPHDQLQHLQLLSRNFQSINIFYVFPRVEDSTDLTANPDLLEQKDTHSVMLRSPTACWYFRLFSSPRRTKAHSTPKCNRLRR